MATLSWPDALGRPFCWAYMCHRHKSSSLAGAGTNAEWCNNYLCTDGGNGLEVVSLNLGELGYTDPPFGSVPSSLPV